MWTKEQIEKASEHIKNLASETDSEVQKLFALRFEYINNQEQTRYRICMVDECIEESECYYVFVYIYNEKDTDSILTINLETIEESFNAGSYATWEYFEDKKLILSKYPHFIYVENL